MHNIHCTLRYLFIIFLAMNILDGWDTSHFKGDFLHHVSGENLFIYNIREPKYFKTKDCPIYKILNSEILRNYANNFECISLETFHCTLYVHTVHTIHCKIYVYTVYNYTVQSMYTHHTLYVVQYIHTQFTVKTLHDNLIKNKKCTPKI